MAKQNEVVTPEAGTEPQDAILEAAKRAARTHTVASEKNEASFGEWTDVQVLGLEEMKVPVNGRTHALRLLKKVNGNDTFLLYPWQIEQIANLTAPGCAQVIAMHMINTRSNINERVNRAMITIRAAWASTSNTYFDKKDQKDYFYNEDHWKVEFYSVTPVAGASDIVMANNRLNNMMAE